ncbi:MAG TPA: hypothetical protein VK034_02410 [Enhygromyxa sp.]|nr:hypothetical protein [Enhygromyxa sp.]
MAASKPRREQWLEHVRAWRASGLSRSEYATKAGLNPQTLGWYAWRLEADGEQLDTCRKPRRRGKAIELAPGMPVVELAALPISAALLELDVAGVTVRLPTDFDAGTLTRLLDVLEARR